MIHQIKSYIKYQIKAENASKLHSPFISNLYSEVISPYKSFYVFEKLEKLRNQLLANSREIKVTDFGAGSKIMKGNTRKVSQIARHSVGGQKESELLFKLVDYFKPATMLELGTSLGLNSLYQLSASPKSRLITFEGCPQTAKIAQENFEAFGLQPEIILGNLDETLKSQLEKLQQVDYVFFDANHQYQPTLNYFEACLAKAHKNSIFIFDDIHWTKGMEQAWQEIKAHPKVSITVDLFDLGLVFFREEEAPKKHFQLKF